MQNESIRISAVSYLNTLPFLYGIKYSGYLENISFDLDYPSICAQKLIDNRVDISLIPVASIPYVKKPYLISDYCIGSQKEVKSVLLISDVPLEQIKSVLLDYQSNTSVNLVKVLAKKYWNIEPKWIQAGKGFENEISGNSAAVVIGDRTFSLSHKFRYVYDLASEWNRFTGKPFVFATWASNKVIEPEFLKRFNYALEFGINHIKEVVDEYSKDFADSNIDLYRYLTENISFLFDHDKKESLNLFYQYLFDLGIYKNNVSNII